MVSNLPTPPPTFFHFISALNPFHCSCRFSFSTKRDRMDRLTKSGFLFDLSFDEQLRSTLPCINTFHKRTWPMAHHNHHRTHRTHWHTSRALVAYLRLVRVINERPTCFQGQSKKTSTLCSRNLFFFFCVTMGFVQTGKRFFFFCIPRPFFIRFQWLKWYCKRKLKKKKN